MRARSTFVAVSAGVLALAGCGSDAADTAAAGPADGGLQVVASTNVWASVTQAVGGDAVEVTGIISDPAADPHSYESTPSDAATVSDADLVVYNGGGYDQFMTDILSSAGGDIRTVDAFELSGHGDVAGVNEHVWYDLPTVEAVADTIATQLAELDPNGAATYTANAMKFTQEVDALVGRTTALAASSSGVEAVATEPVVDYLVEAAGVTLVTPAEFVEAIEEEIDPPAASIAQVDDLLTGGTVGLLVFNIQTESPVTEGVLTTAEESGVPVVEVTETLPEGTDYLGWMSSQIDSLESALSPQE